MLSIWTGVTFCHLEKSEFLYVIDIWVLFDASTLSVLLITQDALVDSVDSDQAAKNMQFDL